MLTTTERPRRSPARLLAILALSLLPAAGCGKGGPELASVTGVVTHKGQPVGQGTITFVAVTPGGRNATAGLGADGSYRLQTEDPGDGAMIGDYQVTVSARDEPVLDYIPTKAPTPKFLVPEKYESPQSSGLKASVKSGSNTFNFDLP